MPFIEINSLKYYYQLSGSGLPLVLLHGFTGSSQNWSSHQAVFAQSYRVLTVDLIGHGLTDKPSDAARYGIYYAANDLIQLVDRVVGCPINLLGYSMGGRLALYTAAHYPEYLMSLMLESASPGLADDTERRERIRQDTLLAERIEREGVEAFVNFWERIPLFASQQHLESAIQKRVRAQRLNNSALGLANSLRGMGTGVQDSLWHRLCEIQLPTAIIAGSLDTKFVGIAQQMYDLMPNAQLKLVPEVGHAVHLEAPEIFRMHIMNFLTRG
jgi:2-succinyl-6-hydroxy-2,4-cyclohexadiene-1-carboxylate synthase